MRGEEVENDLETRLAEGVGRVIVASVADPRYAGAEDRSFSLVEERFARRGRHLRRLRVAVVMVGALVVGGAYWGRAHFADRLGQQLTYEAGPGLASRDGDLVASPVETDPADLRFSDGTRVRLEPRARGRVVRVDRNGATVALYEGKAHVEVRHRADAHWLFDAGPFEVRVHGTAFSVSWNAATARFDLQMESGVVSVAGPISGGEMILRAGQRLSVTLGDHEMGSGPGAALVTGPDEPDKGARPAPGDMPEPPSHRPAASIAPATGRARGVKAWRAELAEGHAAAVVAEAQRRGLGRVLDTADSEDLAALADAARYVGSEDIARRTLHAQRRRFPGSKRAADASFLLGRLEDESSAGAARALGWYDRYLAEAPSGAYASEALGRKMMVLERSGQREDAVAIARVYLRRFATGSYAHAAAALTAPSASVPGSPRTP